MRKSVEVPDTREREIDKAAARAAAAAARGAELLECQQKISALLQEYDAIFIVTEVTRFPNGQRQTTHNVEIVAA